MTHVEDLLADSSGSLVRRLAEGARTARKRAKVRKETRFGIYLYGPEHNGDLHAGRQVGALTLPADDTGEVSADQICRGFVDAQRRAYRETGPIRGALELRFLADPGREELSAPRTWEDVSWGERSSPDFEGEGEFDEEAFMHDDHGISPEEDELGLVHRRRDFAAVREDDYQRNIGLGRHQRELVKDIERDTMFVRLFEQVTEGRRHEQEMTASALAHERRVTVMCLNAILGGGGGGRGGGESDNPARGMKLVADAMSFFKTMSGDQRPRRPARGGRAGRVDDPSVRPAVPPAAFDEAGWDNGGYGRGGAAVDRVLAAKSATDLSDVPAVRGPRTVDGQIDPDRVIAAMDDADLIRAVRGRIGDIAGEHSDLVDGFLSGRLSELENGGGYEGYPDDDGFEDLP